MKDKQKDLHEVEEISLRELIEVILNGKWIIAVVTAAAVLISGIISFFVLSPVYEARTTVMVSDNPENLTTYKEQVQNHMIMSSTIQQLDLHEQDISINGLRKKIDAEIIRDTNLLRVKARDKDPELAAYIANVVTSQFVQHMLDQSIEQLVQQRQYEIQKIEEELEVHTDNLIDVQEKLENTPQILVTNKSLTEDAFLHAVVSENTNRTSADSGSIQYTDEHLNPLYLNLQQKESDLNIKITELENKSQNIKKRISEEQLAVKDHLLIVSQAIEPEVPISPNKVLNIVIAGVLGFVVSAFVVFVRHYWFISSSHKSANRGMRNDQSVSI